MIKNFFFFKKNFTIFLIIFFSINANNTVLSEDYLFEKLKNRDEIQINLSGNNYVRFLKQIQVVGKKIT